MWRQMLVQMNKPPIQLPPIDPIRAPPGQPPGLIPGFPHTLAMPPGLPPGMPPGGTSMVPNIVAMPTPVSSMAGGVPVFSSNSSMAGMTNALNTQSGVRVDGILGLNRTSSRGGGGRKRSQGMERQQGGGGKRRRRPEEDQGMIDLAAGGLTPHQKELSKIQPIILNFDVPPPKVSPTKSIEQRLANLSEHVQGAEGQVASRDGEGGQGGPPRSREEAERLALEARRNVHALPEQRVSMIMCH